MRSGLLRNAVEVPDGVFVQPLVHTDQFVCALGFRFIYADLIAASLAPVNPESTSIKAGRLMLEEIDECVASGQSFAFETTLSGKGYLRKIALRLKRTPANWLGTSDR